MSWAGAESVSIVDPKYLALRELILHRPGGWADEEALRQARALCAAAASEKAADHRKVAVIETLVRDLYSDADHQKWEVTTTTGRDFLRLAILRELEKT